MTSLKDQGIIYMSFKNGEGERSEDGRHFTDMTEEKLSKLGKSFWQYLKDRIEQTGFIPDLSELIRQHALKPG